MGTALSNWILAKLTLEPAEPRSEVSTSMTSLPATVPEFQVAALNRLTPLNLLWLD